MSQEISVAQNKFELLQRQAQALFASGLFNDVKSQAQAIVKVMAGDEMNLSPFKSMSGLHIIQGKVVFSSGLIATLVSSSNKYDYDIIQSDDKVCILEFFKKGEGNKLVSKGKISFSIEEAAKAGLISKDNWKNYPSDMLFARCISRGARRYAADIFGGSVYTPEEMGCEVNEEGSIIDGTLLITNETEKGEGNDIHISSND